MRPASIAIGDEIRVYDDGDWYFTGTVTEKSEDGSTLDVDFADWVERFPVESILLTFPEDGSYRDALVAPNKGVIVEDYR